MTDQERENQLQCAIIYLEASGLIAKHDLLLKEDAETLVDWAEGVMAVEIELDEAR